MVLVFLDRFVLIEHIFRIFTRNIGEFVGRPYLFLTLKRKLIRQTVSGRFFSCPYLCMGCC